MEYFKFFPWEIWLHAASIILWCGTMIYLKRRGFRKRSAHEKHFTGPLKGFRNEVYCQLIRQQAENSLEKLSDALMTEQNALRQLMANTTTRGRDLASELQAQRPSLDHRGQCDASEPVDPAFIDAAEPYGEVARLLELGVHERDISQRVGIPKSQISLIKKLKAYRQVCKGDLVKTDATAPAR